MKRAVWIPLLAILAFAIILLVRLPASWVAGLPAAGRRLRGNRRHRVEWHVCGLVAYNGARVGNLAWELHPSALLRGKLAAFVDLTRGDDFIRGDIEAGASGSVIDAHDLQAQMPLDPPLMPQIAPGFPGDVERESRPSCGWRRM